MNVLRSANPLSAEQWLTENLHTILSIYQKHSYWKKKILRLTLKKSTLLYLKANLIRTVRMQFD